MKLQKLTLVWLQSCLKSFQEKFSVRLPVAEADHIDDVIRRDVTESLGKRDCLANDSECSHEHNPHKGETDENGDLQSNNLILCSDSSCEL